MEVWDELAVERVGECMWGGKIFGELLENAWLMFGVEQEVRFGSVCFVVQI